MFQPTESDDHSELDSRDKGNINNNMPIDCTVIDNSGKVIVDDCAIVFSQDNYHTDSITIQVTILSYSSYGSTHKNQLLSTKQIDNIC